MRIWRKKREPGEEAKPAPKRESLLQREVRRIDLISMVPMSLIALPLFLLLGSDSKEFDWRIGVCLGVYPIAFGLSFWVGKRMKLRPFVLKELEAMDALQIISDWGYRTQSIKAYPKALAQLEPLLTARLKTLLPEDLERLDMSQRNQLYGLMLLPSKPIQLAGLQALETMQDREALIHVQALATSRDTEVAERATQCMERLKQAPLRELSALFTASGEVEEMIATLRSLQKSKRLFVASILVEIAVLVMSIQLGRDALMDWFASLYERPFWMLFACLGTLALGITPFCLVVLTALRRHQRWGELTYKLAQTGDVRSLSHILDTLLDTLGEHSVSSFRPILLRLLPRLKASDANLLTPGQKSRLSKLLYTGSTIDSGANSLGQSLEGGEKTTI